jgi:hypothetical protein
MSTPEQSCAYQTPDELFERVCEISFAIDLRLYDLRLDLFRNVWLNEFARVFCERLGFR